jgi:hypothetical protein
MMGMAAQHAKVQAAAAYSASQVTSQAPKSSGSWQFLSKGPHSYELKKDFDVTKTSKPHGSGKAAPTAPTSSSYSTAVPPADSTGVPAARRDQGDYDAATITKGNLGGGN